MKTSEEIVKDFFNITKIEFLENGRELIALVQMALNECESNQVQAAVKPEIAEEYKPIIKWFIELALELHKANFEYEAIPTIDIDAWYEFYKDDLTPDEAVYEDLSNA